MSTRPSSWRGATLIEVLVTILLLSFGTLSLAGLQAYAVAASKNAVNRGLAAALANDLADMIRANPAGFTVGAYNQAPSFSANATSVPAVNPADFCAYPACTPVQLAALDLALFNARLKATLRAGAYAVIPIAGATSHADIYVLWQEQRGAGTAAAEKSFDSCPAALTELLPLPDPFPRCYYIRVNL